MNKQLGVVLFSFLDLDKSSPIPLFQQMNTQIRQAVLSGRLPSHIRLPSSRVLALDIGVSRTTVVTAFEQLIAEGYLESRIGAGTYVAGDLAEIIGYPPSRPNAGGADKTRRASKLSRRGTLLAKTISYETPVKPGSFLPNQPAYDQFPFAIWSRFVARKNRNPSYESLNYGNAAGYLPLRQAIADHLRHARGINCDSGQVIVVTGAQIALSLSTWVLMDPGDEVIMENPSLLATRDMIIGFGGKVVNAPVDKNGMNFNAAISKAPNARMAIVTASNQYPLGVTLSLSRRLEMLAWANQKEGWIIEDDYDSEFRFSGAPLEPMQTIDQNGRVIYVGTFSKVLFPSLRIGYLVVPPDLADAYCAAVHLLNRSAPTLDQAALAEFINNGHFSAHIRRMRLIYAERQGAIVAALRKTLAGLLEISATQTGLNVIGWLPQDMSDVVAVQQLRAHGILSAPMSPHFAEQNSRQGLLLGFGCTPVDEIQPCVDKMARALGV